MTLDPGERISMIKAVGSSLMEESLPNVKLALDTFGVPERVFDGFTASDYDKYQYVLERLSDAQDAAVAGLHAHLSGHAPTPDEPEIDPPAKGEPLIFISHTWKNKVLAGEVSQTFSELGIKGFVAHEDIEPTKEWAAEIERNLHTCSALVAVLTEDFRESAFCDQEIGYALGRGRLVVAVMQDGKPPHGLAGKYQAIPGNHTGNPGRRIAENVLDVLLEQAMTRPLVIESVATRYAKSTSFDNARANYARLLKVEAGEWTPEMIEIVGTCGQENGQLIHGMAQPPGSKDYRPIPELVKEHLDLLLSRSDAAESGAAGRVIPEMAESGSAQTEDDIPF